MEDGIYHVKEYNKLQLSKYREDCQNWDRASGGFPQIAFYLFEQDHGYILKEGNRSRWFGTKREAKVIAGIK